MEGREGGVWVWVWWFSAREWCFFDDAEEMRMVDCPVIGLVVASGWV